jgi:hypothetical protein
MRGPDDLGPREFHPLEQTPGLLLNFAIWQEISSNGVPGR